MKTTKLKKRPSIEVDGTEEFIGIEEDPQDAVDTAAWADEGARRAKEKADAFDKKLLELEADIKEAKERSDDPYDASTDQDEDDIKILGGGDNASDWAFGVEVTGNLVTVQAGPIYVQGMQRVDVAKVTDYTITGEYVWPTVQIPIADVASASIIYPNAIPAPDTTNVYIPLVRLVCTNWTGTKDQYDTDGDGHILHRGAIHLSNPLTYQ